MTKGPRTPDRFLEIRKKDPIEGEEYYKIQRSRHDGVYWHYKLENVSGWGYWIWKDNLVYSAVATYFGKEDDMPEQIRNILESFQLLD